MGKTCLDCDRELTNTEVLHRHARCNKCRHWHGRAVRMEKKPCTKCGRKMSGRRSAAGIEICSYCEKGKLDKAEQRQRKAELASGFKPTLIKALRCKPGNCQICNNWDTSYTAPDGTNVPCCKGCYFTTMALVEREAKRKGKTAVITARGLVFR